MSIHKSYKRSSKGGGLQKNVLTRFERVSRLIKEGKLSDNNRSTGLPKTRVM